jgi:hypothetical protein
MVKETAAARREREAKEFDKAKELEWAEFTAAYPANFANLIFEYMGLYYAGFRVRKIDSDTYNFNREDYSWKEFTLQVVPPKSYTWEYINDFDNAYKTLADYAAEKAEERRRESVRMAALAKLSKEERELLGVK